MISSVSAATNTVEEPEEYDEIRELLLEKSPDDIGRELPGLIESIKEQSVSDENMIRYDVGVSFTKRGTCFDYWLERVIWSEEHERPLKRMEKAPISSTHHYVTFSYPPDSEFDAASLRGVLIATLEGKAGDSQSNSTDNDTGLFHRIRESIVQYFSK